jgi:hypothetical protein
MSINNFQCNKLMREKCPLDKDDLRTAFYKINLLNFFVS